MKFIVSKTTLLDALTTTGKCISKNILPIMESYYLRVDQNQLLIIGSNMEVTIEKQLAIESDISAVITLPGKRLFDLIKELPEQPLQFNINNYSTDTEAAIAVEIIAASGIYKIPATNGLSYNIQDNKQAIKFTIESDTLIEGINKTIFACSTDELRPAMCCVLFQFDDGNLTLAATNAHILSTHSYDVAIDGAYTFLVPTKVLHILAALVHDANIGIDMDEKSIVFYVNDTTVLRSRLIDEKYPDYKSVIPQDNDKTITIFRPDLLASLNRVTQFTDDNNYSIKLDIGPDSVNLLSENALGETASETIPNRYQGEPTSVRFNGKNLMLCLKHIGSDEVTLSFKAPNRPFLMRTTDDEPEANTNLMLLMPLAT